jgi:homoserine acetyltransferase
MADYEIFELREVVLQCGLTLRQAKLVYKTYGELNAARDNVIVMPTFYGGQLAENEVMIAAWQALDPKRHFIIVPNLAMVCHLHLVMPLRHSIMPPSLTSPCTTTLSASIA